MGGNVPVKSAPAPQVAQPQATRISFRARPLDPNKQLQLVRDLADLDKDAANRGITHGHEALDAENEEVRPRPPPPPAPPSPPPPPPLSPARVSNDRAAASAEGGGPGGRAPPA